MFSQLTTERIGVLALGLAAKGSLVDAGPCDIYSAGGTPCIAAHSTTRALYSDFNGPLYQVQRGSDHDVADIRPLSTGGVADADAQDSFCAGTTCLISIIYDQSGLGNHLTQAPPGGFNGPEAGGYDSLASASAEPVLLNGLRAYGVFMSPGCGYRNNNVSKSATGDEPQGMYGIFDGEHFNDGCCFDYGNAETSSLDTGNGHMEAIYFGNNAVWGTGAGNGPWIMADLENGLFSGVSPKNNPNDKAISHRFTTAIVKGEPNHWAIRGGDASSGSLTTYYDGERPRASGYNPMSKEGAIILGIGGDNSVGAQGTFYEGVMTTGYPSDDTEDLVQADIVAAKYEFAPLSSGPELTPYVPISLRVTTPGYATRYLAHEGNVVNTQVVSIASSAKLKRQASWQVLRGLANTACYSFESVDNPGSFLRHSDFNLHVNANDGTKQFREDATFCIQIGLSGLGTTIRSWNYPARYIRHFNNVVHIASNGGVRDFDTQTRFIEDVSWVIDSAFE
ncbi:Arabinosidase B [Xylaria nigripes]|nr:Arabinosidase B [Xylaria nigripes]